MRKQLTLGPSTTISGKIQLPGSKSLSNRALLLAALAQGKTQIHNLLDSDDVQMMLQALAKLGVKYEHQPEQYRCNINQGITLDTIQSAIKEDPLIFDLGNAGTAVRPLTAILSHLPINSIVTGDQRMQERPIAHLVDGLRELGATITYQQQPGYPPLHIQGQPLTGKTAHVDGSISSQYLTALLMLAPLLDENITIHIEHELVSKPYIQLTLAILKQFGVDVAHEQWQRFTIYSGQFYQSPGEYWVEGDASSASYFLGAAAIAGEITVHGVGRDSTQGDIAFAEVLAEMGAIVEWQAQAITVRRGQLKGIDRDVNHIPDAAMTLAIVALFAEGTTTLRNIYNWRVKETDRLHAMATELRKVGAIVEEGTDYLSITPPKKLQMASIHTYHDHRMAMCFSLLAFSPVGINILDPDCCQKTFPEYFSLWQQVVN